MLLGGLSAIIGWLGVAVTGADTSSNSLFGTLQVRRPGGADHGALGSCSSS